MPVHGGSAEPFVLGKALFISNRTPRAGAISRAATDGSKPDIAILAYGTEVYEALKAMDSTWQNRATTWRRLYDALQFAKPVDIDLVQASLIEVRHILILTGSKTTRSPAASAPACSKPATTADCRRS